MTFKLPPGDTHFKKWAVYGEYQKETFERALAATKGRSLAIDIGAHVGFWSCMMAKHFTRVLAFEPVSENFQCLCANVPANVIPHAYAVGLRLDYREMKNPNPGNSGAWEIGDGGGDTCILPLDYILLGDFLLRETTKAWCPPNLIKIDAQGFELNVLRGAEDQLTMHHPTVCVEVVHDGHHDPAPGEFLKPLGYELHEFHRKDEIWRWPA